MGVVTVPAAARGAIQDDRAGVMSIAVPREVTDGVLGAVERLARGPSYGWPGSGVPSVNTSSSLTIPLAGAAGSRLRVSAQMG